MFNKEPKIDKLPQVIIHVPEIKEVSKVENTAMVVAAGAICIGAGVIIGSMIGAAFSSD